MTKTLQTKADTAARLLLRRWRAAESQQRASRARADDRHRYCAVCRRAAAVSGARFVSRCGAHPWSRFLSRFVGGIAALLPRGRPGTCRRWWGSSACWHRGAEQPALVTQTTWSRRLAWDLRSAVREASPQACSAKADDGGDGHPRLVATARAFGCTAPKSNARSPW